MTTYRAIAGSETLPEAPLTSALLTALALNPLAVGEAASGVPSSALPTVLLGTLTTTSGTTQTLSGLVLTPYKFLRITLNNVSFTVTGNAVRLGGAGKEITANLGTAGQGFYGTVLLDLSNGIATAMTSELNAGASGVGILRVTATGYSTATTSISFDGGTFDAGTISVYGEK